MVTEILELLEDLDLSTAFYSKQIGKNPTYIAMWRMQGASNETVLPVAQKLLNVADTLISANLRNQDLLKLLGSSGLKLATVADRAGVSRQAIYRAHDLGLNETQIERFEKTLKEIGSEMRTRISDLIK